MVKHVDVLGRTYGHGPPAVFGAPVYNIKPIALCQGFFAGKVQVFHGFSQIFPQAVEQRRQQRTEEHGTANGQQKTRGQHAGD